MVGTVWHLPASVQTGTLKLISNVVSPGGRRARLSRWAHSKNYGTLYFHEDTFGDGWENGQGLWTRSVIARLTRPRYKTAWYIVIVHHKFSGPVSWEWNELAAYLISWWYFKPLSLTWLINSVYLTLLSLSHEVNAVITWRRSCHRIW